MHFNGIESYRNKFPFENKQTNKSNPTFYDDRVQMQKYLKLIYKQKKKRNCINIVETEQTKE